MKSADGAARVDVPVGALPAGLRVEDIKIAAVDPASLPVTFPDGPVLAAYKLEPDGTKFTTPVTFSVTRPSKEAFLPSVVMISGDEVSAVLEIDVAFDAEAETLTVSTKLDHFSTWTMVHKAFFTVDIENISDQLLDREFAVTASVAVTTNRYRMVAKVSWSDDILGLNETEMIQLNGSPLLVGGFNVIRGPVVSAGTGLNPGKQELKTYGIYTGLFYCMEVGVAQIGYTASLTVPTYWVRKLGFGGAITGSQLAQYEITVRGEPFQCRATLPTVPPTPYVSPSQNRPPQVSPIQAVLAYPSRTTYSVVASDPDGDVLTALWEGMDCGKPQTFGPRKDTLEGGQGGFEMLWDHAVTFCHRETFRTPEPLPEHANTVIKVTISDASSLTDAALKRFHWQVICTYTSVGTGTGPACSAPVNVEK